jgi:iron uptake system component EfeO
VATTSLPVDRTTFAVTKQGPEVTEVYVYAAGDRGERENFGPGTMRDLAVTLDAGNYDVACKPKMTGDGIRTKITVTK